MRITKQICYISFSLITLFTSAQCDLISVSKEVYQWRFFQKSGLDFNTMTNGKPEFVSSELVGSPGEGSASIADANGDLIFYTDGINVYDVNDNLVVNGTGLLGNPSATSSAIIFPHPTNPDQYYIATVDEGDDGPLRYSVFNKTIGATGGIVAASKNTIVTDFDIYEKIGAVAHSNGSDNWVIVTESKSNNYHAYHFDENGIVESVKNTVGPAFANYDDDFGKGYIKPSVDGTQLIIASADEAPRGFVEVFQFDNETGVISSYPTPKRTYLNAAYGVEISPNGRYLYVSQRDKFPEGGTKSIFQFDLEAADFEGSKVNIGTMEQGGALQIGPDGKIYASQAKYGYLGRIENPNAAGAASNYVQDAIYLEGNKSGEGLPTFVSSFFDQSIDAGPNRSICEGETVELGGDPTAQGGQAPYIYSWDNAGDLDDSNNANPNATPNTSTTYILTVTDDLGCTNTDKVKITVKPKPLVDAGNDITTCVGGSVNLGGAPSAQGGTGELSYLWTPSAGLDADFLSNPTLTVTGNATYTLTVTDSVNCSTSATIHITTEERLTLDVTVLPATCSEDIGSIELITGGSSAGPFSYEWQNPSLSTHSFLMNENIELTANFEPSNPTYTLTIINDGLGSVLAPKTLLFNPGEVVDLTAMPYKGYFFSNWTGDLSGSDYHEQIIMNSDRVITAHFAPDFTGSSIRVEGEDESKWDFDDRLDEGCSDEYRTFGFGTNYIESGSASVGQTAYPTGGDWRALWWVYDGNAGNFDLNLRWHDRNSDSDEKAEVIFQVGRRNASCVFPPSNNGNYKVFDNWNTGDFDQGWHINEYKSVYIEPGDSIIIYQNRESTQGIALIDYIDFIEAPVVLNTSINGNGEILLAPNAGIYPYQTLLNLEARPEPGSIFNNWSEDLVSTSLTETYLIERNSAITANFSSVNGGDYTLHSYVNGNGSLSKSSNQEVFSGNENVEITAVPESNYEFKSWSTNLTKMDSLAAGDYTITVSDEEGCTLEKTFIVESDIAIIPIDLQGETSVCSLDTVKLTGTALASTQKSYWYIDGGLVDSLSNNLDTLGLAAGQHEIIYNLQQDECGEAWDTLFVTVVELAKADILLHMAGDTVKTSEDNYTLEHNQDLYSGAWQLVDNSNSGASLIESDPKVEINSLVDDAILELKWTVQDPQTICPSVTDSVFVVKVNGVVPDAGNDTSICVSSLPFARSGNGDQTDVTYETYRWIDPLTNTTITSANDLTIPASYSPGEYEFVFEITYSVSGIKRDTFSFTIVELAKADILTHDAGTTIKTSENNYTLEHNQDSYSGAWQLVDNSNSGASLIENDPELEINSLVDDAILELKWTVQDPQAICPSVTDSVFVVKVNGTVPHAGNDTSICVSSLPFTRSSNGSETDVAYETYRWIDPLTNSTITSANDLTIPASYSPGEYEFVFEITHSVSGIKRDTFKLTVVDFNTADILNYMAADTLKIGDSEKIFTHNSISNLRSGSWELESLHSNPADTSMIGDDLLLDNIIREHYVLVKWQVQDLEVVCPVAVDSLWFIRHGVTPAIAQGDSICLDIALIHTIPAVTIPNAAKGEISEWKPTNALASASAFSQNGFDLEIDITTAGVYTFDYIISNPTVTTKSGNILQSDTSVTIVVEEVPRNVFAGNDSTICTSSIQLEASNHSGYTGHWETLDNTLSFSPSANSANTIVSNITGTVELSWLVESNSGICPQASDKVQITSTGDMTVPDLEDDKIICVTSFPLQLSGNKVKTTETAVWSGFDPSTSTVNNETMNINTLTLGEHIFTYTISNNVCSDLAKAITITVVDTPNVQLMVSDTAICNDTGSIQLTVSGSEGTGFWYRNGNLEEEILFTGSASLELNKPAQSGMWHFELQTDYCPLTSSSAQTTNIYDRPEAQLQAPFEIYKGDEIEIEGSSSTSAFSWIANENLLSSDLHPIAHIIGKEEGEFIYSFIAINGLCRDTASIKGIVKLPIAIPEVFTPNGDGIFDTWNIVGLASEQASIKVYNRWGSIVFESTGSYIPWDGDFNGNPVPDATYYYIIEVEDDSTLHGNVTVVR